jgi:diacylglycerol O-acyltransferase / wax synthase
LGDAPDETGGTSELLSPLDLAFWNLDSSSHPLYLGAMAVFERDPGTDVARIASLLAGRAAAVRRLRRRVQRVWYPVGGAAWVPDGSFDARSHVRVERLPDGAGQAESAALAAELMTRPMDRNRPPWELYVIDGPGSGSLSVLVKLHHALVDGLSAVKFGTALLDQSASVRRPPRKPAARRTLPFGVPDPRRLIRETGQALGVGASVVRASLTTPGGPAALTAPYGVPTGNATGTRRLATVALDLDDLKRIRKTTGGTVNDVVMALVGGALRDWMHDRGDGFPRREPRALIPVARRRSRSDPGTGNRISGYLLRLPAAEPDPLARVRRVREAMERNKAAGPDAGPGAVALLADTVPALAQRLGAPLVGRAAPLLFDLLVTNVPLPDIPLSLDGCHLRELYPVAPLACGQSLAVAASTYRGRAHIGLFADAAAVPDLERLVTCLHENLAELTIACAVRERAGVGAV